VESAGLGVTRALLDMALLPDLEGLGQFADEASAEVHPDTGTEEDLTIVLPALNEEKALAFVIGELRELGYGNTLVVDGHSDDGTVEVAKELNVGVLVQPGRGKTDAVRTAVSHVKTPYMLVMDADATYDPRHILEMLRHAPEYDEVIGVRAQGRRNIPVLNRLGNCAITKTFNLLFGTKLKDVCSGMYLLRTEVAREMSFESQGFSAEVEVAAHVASTSRRIKDVEVTYRQRIGKPKLRSLHGLSIILNVVRLTMRYNPVFLILMIASLLMLPSLAVLGWVAYELLFLGVNHFVWATIAVIGTGVATVSFLLSLLALYLKRMELRLLEKLRKLPNR